MSNKKIMEENIKNYASQIETIDDFVQIVRLRPGMYLGPIGNKGLLNMIREIFQNSVDEMVKEDSPCSWINVIYDERTHTTTVEDNGRGIPFEAMVRIFTSQHTSSNYTKKEGEFSSGMNGVGSKVTNAMSQWFTVESYILGEARKMEFVEGKPKYKEPKVIPNNNKQGTIVSFRPSYESLGDINLTVDDVLGLILLILPLTKIGSIINFKGIYSDGKEVVHNMVNTDGILTNLIMKTTSPIIAPVVISKYTGTMTVDIGFTYDSNDLMVENVTCFANFCPTIQGTHLDGFLEGLCTFFRNYMNKVYLASNKKKLQIINADIKTGLKGIIHVKHLNPVLVGQSKEILDNKDVIPFVKDTVIQSLEQWAKENPKDLQKICKYYKEVAELRVKSEEGKVKLSSKYESSSLSAGMPKKFTKPSGKKNLELIICEGDSAAGSGKNSRCRERQGLFPIRGKMPNAFVTERSKFLSNEEVAAIITIVGGGYGRTFDISKVKWEKVIFTCDADPDGKHISSLLLKFFLLYMPDMITHGRVYKAVPPLYSIKNGNKYTYLTDRLQYVEYVQKYFISNNTLTTTRGGKLTNKEISKILYENIDYTYDLESVANKYAIHYNLLELVVMNLDKSVKELTKIIKKEYRFMDVEIINNVPVIKGLIDGKYQTLFLNQQIINECGMLIEYVKKNDSMYYLLNNNTVSLYTLMKLFENNAPKNLQRYKGLGEMNPKQLAESTLHPDSNRTLIQYTMESAAKEIEMMRYLESNKTELLKDIKVSRLDIMG